MTDSNVPPRPQPAQSASIDPHPIEFTGDGGEYFRVWIVNLLLSIVTLGLYTPWARRRTVKYFYAHTRVADSPLEFTAGARSMVIGFLLLAALYIGMQVASDSGYEVVVNLIMLAGLVLAPWLWGSAMRFRLGNTRWRGLRLNFVAGWGEIYRASWPVFALAALWLVLGVTLNLIAPPAPPADAPAARTAPTTLQPTQAADDADAQDSDTPADEAAELPALPSLPTVTAPMWGVMLLGLLLTLILLARLEYNYRILLARRTQIGSQAGRWYPGFGPFLRIWFETLGVFLLSVALVLGLTVLGTLLLGGAQLLSPRAAGLLFMFWLFMLATIASAVGLFLAISPALAYREARMFQLLWNDLGVSRIARFRTSLRTGAFVALRLKNLLLTVLTLGFYRPFARVSEYRMKAETTMLYIKGGLEPLVGQLAQQQKEGFGDAVADALGLDLIG